MSTKKVLRSFRISFEMDLEVAKIVAERAFEVPKVSQADVVEEYFMRGLQVPVRDARPLMDDETRFTLEEIAETQGMTVAALLRLTFVETQPTVSPSPPAAPEPSNLPKNAFCKHCGLQFTGARYATICPACKSIGHTLTPAECPICNEGAAI